MKSYWISILFLILAVIASAVLISRDSLYKPSVSSSLPKKIWTYWNSEDLPKSIKYCMTTWKTHNPDYDITLITNTNLPRYLHGFDISTFRHADSLARISDVVRLHVLARHGGVWMDASMICNRSFNWLEDMLQGKEFFGYYMNSFTKTPAYPVIESWFFACIPNSPFVGHWRDTFMKMNKFDTVQAYINALKTAGTDPQGIPPSLQSYLAIHMAAQYVLQVLKYPTSKLALLKCEDGPFQYLVRNSWDSEKAIKEVVENRVKTDLIKLRGDERKVFDKLCCPYTI